jgi:hypothetical protein
MACDILLYDRLIFPVPTQQARTDWIRQGWDPEERLRQLGALAVRRVWTERHHENWQRDFENIALDAEGEVRAALRYIATRRVLAQDPQNYRKPPGVDRILVYAAFQSEDQVAVRNHVGAEPEQAVAFADKTARMNGLVAARILVPDERDGEESLKRALEFTTKPDFLDARRDFFDWQQDVLMQGLSPEDATDRLQRAIKRYNGFVERSGRSWRTETIVTALVVAGSVATAAATVAPGIFAPLVAFGLTGNDIVTLGGAAVGAVAQLSKQAFSRAGGPDPMAEPAAAMFHQLEVEDRWQRRAANLAAQ